MLTTNYSFVFKLSFWGEGGGWSLCTHVRLYAVPSG